MAVAIAPERLAPLVSFTAQERRHFLIPWPPLRSAALLSRIQLQRVLHCLLGLVLSYPVLTCRCQGVFLPVSHPGSTFSNWKSTPFRLRRQLFSTPSDISSEGRATDHSLGDNGPQQHGEYGPRFTATGCKVAKRPRREAHRYAERQSRLTTWLTWWRRERRGGTMRRVLRNRGVGWGPRIRTSPYGFRVRCPTARRVPSICSSRPGEEHAAALSIAEHADHDKNCGSVARPTWLGALCISDLADAVACPFVLSRVEG